MVGYIYRITNVKTGKCYVGITEDFKRRKKKHRAELNCHIHHSPKLQNAWDYWGEENFEWTVREVEISCYDDLYELEIEEIKKYNSYEDGYNCNSGEKISDWHQKVKNEDVVKFLCVQYYYGNGYGKTFEQIFNWAKGTASAAKRRLKYVDALCTFDRMTDEEKKQLAKQVFQDLSLDKIAFERQLKQGGCSKAYQLTQNDFNFAFCAQELKYGYAEVADIIGIKPATVKDWFNGRSRAKEKAIYQKLSFEEKEKIKQQVVDSFVNKTAVQKSRD